MRRDLHKRFAARTVDCFSAGPQRVGVHFTAATDTAPAEILIYDVIGASYWDDGVTAKGVMAALAEAGDGPVKVRINSPGGDVFEGLAIYNALRAHPGAVDVQVDGLAASAASFIALAGSSLTMNDSTMFMIHNASTVSFGNRHDMTATAGVLAKIDGQMQGIYARKTGMEPDAVAAAMDAETYYTAAEAKEAGFADAVNAAPAKAPKAEAAPASTVQARDVMRARLRVAESVN